MLKIHFISPETRGMDGLYRFDIGHDHFYKFSDKRKMEAFRGQLQKFYTQRVISANYIYSNLLGSIRKAYPFMTPRELSVLKSLVETYDFHFNKILRDNQEPPKKGTYWAGNVNTFNAGNVLALHRTIINIANEAFELAQAKNYYYLKYEVVAQSESINSATYLLTTLSELAKDFGMVPAENTADLPKLKIA